MSAAGGKGTLCETSLKVQDKAAKTKAFEAKRLAEEVATAKANAQADSEKRDAEEAQARAKEEEAAAAKIAKAAAKALKLRVREEKLAYERRQKKNKERDEETAQVVKRAKVAASVTDFNSKAGSPVRSQLYSLFEGI